METTSIKKVKGILLVDVETTTLGKAIVMEIAFYTINKFGAITSKGHYILKEQWQSDYHRKGKFAEPKLAKWQQDIDNKITKVITTEKLAFILAQKIKKYNINIFSAYNANFDKTALANTFRQHRVFDPTRKLKLFCLWNYSKSIYGTKDYITWAIKNEKLTPTSKIKTSVEVVNQYLIENVYEQETHIAHEDLLIEYNILRSAIMQNTINRNNKLELEKNGHWGLVEDIRKQMGL
jgi:hypothetical protein